MSDVQSKMNGIKQEPIDELLVVEPYNDPISIAQIAQDVVHIREQLRIAMQMLTTMNPGAAFVLPQQGPLVPQQHQQQQQQQQEENQENLNAEMAITPTRNVKIRDPPVESVVTFDSTMSPKTIAASKPAKIPKVQRIRPILTKRNTKNEANAASPKPARRDRPTIKRRRRQTGPLRRSVRLRSK